jgi:hypothetical protein
VTSDDDIITLPAATAPLPRGWHRLVWTQDNKQRYIVTTDVSTVVALYSILCVLRDHDPWARITAVQDAEHWQPGAITEES